MTRWFQGAPLRHKETAARADGAAERASGRGGGPRALPTGINYLAGTSRRTPVIIA